MSRYHYWMDNNYPQLLKFLDQFTLIEWAFVIALTFNLILG